MQTITQRPRRRTKAAAPPYPLLPDTDHRLFWLAAYLRDLAELQTLDALCAQAHRQRRSFLVTGSLTSARLGLGDKLRESAAYVREEGLILFAHPDTTALDGVGARA